MMLRSTVLRVEFSPAHRSTAALRRPISVSCEIAAVRIVV
jgi:hypothetical protein